MAKDQAMDAASAAKALGINLPGIGIFLASLVFGVVARLLIPDAVMSGPKPPMSSTATVVGFVVVVPFLLWLALWFRSPGSPRVTAVGAAWSALLTVLAAIEIWMTKDWALLPGLAVIASFAVMTVVAWIRLLRRTPPA